MGTATQAHDVIDAGPEIVATAGGEETREAERYYRAVAAIYDDDECDLATDRIDSSASKAGDVSSALLLYIETHHERVRPTSLPAPVRPTSLPAPARPSSILENIMLGVRVGVAIGFVLLLAHGKGKRSRAVARDLSFL